MIYLLDVNVLLSIVDRAHLHHRSVFRWFHEVATVSGWATCSITENGFVRILSQISYPNATLTPAAAGDLLGQLKSSSSGLCQFWPSDVSITDQRIFALELLTGTKQTTDLYLAGLAFSNGGKFATLAGRVAWRAVRGAGEDLIERVPI